MRIADAPATVAIATITIAASIVLLMTGWLPYAALAGGFVPVRIDGVAPFGQMAWTIPSWLTPVTATLVHAGVAHLTLNIVMLLICGVATERATGIGGMLILYFAGAYAAAFAQWALDPLSAVPMIGASGAISSVVAAYAILYGRPRTRSIGPFSANAVHVAWLATAWIGIQSLIGLAGLAGGDAGSVAIAAHIGGFVVGLILAKPILLWRYRGA